MDDFTTAAVVRQMLYGRLLSQALVTAVDLRLPDLFAAGPSTATEIAKAANLHEPSLQRLLRGLSAFDVFAAHEDGRFSLRPLGHALRDNAPVSLRPTALLIDSIVGRAWDNLSFTVRTGASAFRETAGQDFFTHLDSNPELRATFDRSQAEGLAVEVSEILDGVPFAASSVVVDVGGGDGYLLEAILKAHPTVRGVLVDLPLTAALAEKRLHKAGLSDRAEVQAGDFFKQLPGDGDLYLLSHVLHDWDDSSCVRLLRACRDAMPPDATLVIVDIAADERPGTDEQHRASALMDLYMMSLFGEAKERSLAEFDSLLVQAGFGIDQSQQFPSGLAAVHASVK